MGPLDYIYILPEVNQRVPPSYQRKSLTVSMYIATQSYSWLPGVGLVAGDLYVQWGPGVEPRIPWILYQWQGSQHPCTATVSQNLLPTSHLTDCNFARSLHTLLLITNYPPSPSSPHLACLAMPRERHPTWQSSNLQPNPHPHAPASC